MRAIAVPALLALLVACESAADVDTGDTDANAPDLVGSYDATVADTSGCDGDDSALRAWAEGALAITGTPSELSFGFAGATLPGVVDDTHFVELGDTVSIGGTDVTIFADGVATLDGDAWLIELQVTHEVVDASPACTISGTLTARQVD